jgi:hypothetical protein
MNPRDADRADADVSPAARRIVNGALFDLDGGHYMVESRFPDGGDVTRDVVVIHGVEYMRCDLREIRRAVQMRDIEARIAHDRVEFAFGPAALDVNISCRWTTARPETKKLDHLVAHLDRGETMPASERCK